MLLEISGEITPKRMKGWSQSKNKAQPFHSFLSYFSTDLHWPGEFIFQCHIFLPFIQFLAFSRQEHWSGLPFPSPVDHILSEHSTMTRSSSVAIHHMAHSFIELDKAVVHMISLISFLWLWFSICLPFLKEKDKRFMEASWWERLRGKLGLVLIG